VLDVGEEPVGQERSNAHGAIARILGNWRGNLFRARGGDRKKAVPDTKQTFSDKKMPFRHLSGRLRWAYQLPNASSFLFRRYSNDPPQPLRSRRHRRFRRSHRLLRHDRTEG
jgi:hypothetical protein